MRVLVDNIAWGRNKSADITALPFIDVIEVDDEDIQDQDTFIAATRDALEEKHNFICDGFHWEILEGTIH